MLGTAQREFAQVIGRLLAERWRAIHSPPQTPVVPEESSLEPSPDGRARDTSNSARSSEPGCEMESSLNTFSRGEPPC